MPGLRLSLSEASAIAGYLATLGADDTPPAPAALAPPFDQALVDRGAELVAGYGCSGCHDIPGFEDDGPPGPELLDYGTKDPHDMDFGVDDLPRGERTWARFTEHKLRAPRDLARPGIELTMPDFGLGDADVQALAIYLRGLRAGLPPRDYVAQPAIPAAARRGARFVAERGCGTCHGFDGREPDIARHYAAPHLRPPPLEGVAAKLRPQFFFDYLLRPGPLRPWLEVRMPDFALTADVARDLVAYFADLEGVDGPLRPMGVDAIDHARAAAGASLFEALKCVSCHVLDTELGVESAELAPDLALARQRLDPAWVRRFLEDPGALLPRTKMPQFFPGGQTPFPDLLGGDADKQIGLLVDHLMNLGLQPMEPPAP